MLGIRHCQIDYYGAFFSAVRPTLALLNHTNDRTLSSDTDVHCNGMATAAS